jgi:hypothetical protein
MGGPDRSKLTGPNDSFFVDAFGKPLSLEHARSSRTGEEMAREMGVARLPTFTEQRRVVASKMISAGATGETGMAHTPAVQRVIYDDLRRERGVANKKLANKSLLEKTVDARIIDDGSRDSSFGQAVAEKCRSDAEDAVAQLRNDAKEKLFRQFLSLVTLRGPRRTILSRERYNFLRAIYSMISPEFTAAVLFSRPYPTESDRTMARRFHRFLCTSGEGMRLVRENCVAILRHAGASNSDVDLSKPTSPGLFLRLAAMWHSCLMSLDMSRVNKSPRLHTLFNFQKVGQKLRLLQPPAVALPVSPAPTASTTPTAEEKKKEEQEEKKAAEVNPEKKEEEEDSFPMSLPSLSSPPPQKEAEMMWPNDELFETKELLNLISGKFEDTTLPSLPLGQGRPSSTTATTDDDDDAPTVATVVPASSSPRKRSFDDTVILSDDEDP